MRILIVLALSLFAVNAVADESAKNSKLEALVNVMDMDSMVDSLYTQMERQMQDMSSQMGVTAEEQPIFDEYYNKMTLIMKQNMNWDKMEPMIIDLYDEYFDEKEINAMLDFYDTEVGQSILAKMPDLMQESMQLSQGMLQDVLPEIQSLAQQLQQDLQAARQDDGEVAAKE